MSWYWDGTDDLDRAHDPEIVGLITEHTLFEHPEFRAFYDKEYAAELRSAQARHYSDEDAKSIADSEARLAWRREASNRNRTLRRQHKARRECRATFEALCPRHASVVLSESFQEHDAVRKLRTWNEDRTRTIAVLAGPPGVGKTTCAAWWAWHRTGGIRTKELPAWLTAAAFARSDRYDGRDDVFASPTVLDDLGVEFNDSRGSFRTDFDELVDAFYRTNTPLVITTNLDADTFEARYGARVFDRLREAGTWIPVIGASRRGRS